MSLKIDYRRISPRVNTAVTGGMTTKITKNAVHGCKITKKEHL